MLVVFASAYDATAQAIAAEWGAACCTPADLSTTGWRHRVGEPGQGVAVVAGQIVPAGAIAGVLTRLSAVQPDELPQFAAADRDYVAAEMTAFLTAFITALPCRVLNRPTAGALSGPAWRPEQWIRAAFGAGVPVRTRQRRVRPDALAQAPEDVAIEITVIGDQVFGIADDRLADWARLLARIAGVDLLGVGFGWQASGYALASVNPWPSLDTPDRLHAARDFLLAGGKGPRP